MDPGYKEGEMNCKERRALNEHHSRAARGGARTGSSVGRAGAPLLWSVKPCGEGVTVVSPGTFAPEAQQARLPETEAELG